MRYLVEGVCGPLGSCGAGVPDSGEGSVKARGGPGEGEGRAWWWWIFIIRFLTHVGHALVFNTWFFIHRFFNTRLLAARPDLPLFPPQPGGRGGGEGWGGKGGGQAGQPATMY